MSRQGNLTKQELAKIKEFRYKTCPLTPLETTIYDPFWTFIANNFLPDWLAPNALTLIGLIVPAILLVTICVLDPSLSQTLPCWVWLLAWFAAFWYQTIDAIDGKQARRTDNCSPLGQILDHNLDQVTFTCIFISCCSILHLGDDITRILLLTPGVMSAHYSIEYRTHFTQMHQTVIGFVGATEQLLFVQAPTLAAFFLAESSDYLQWMVPLQAIGIDHSVKLGDIMLGFAAITGAHFNIENIVVAFAASKDKGYALACILPYAQFFAMMYASSFSQWFSGYPSAFIMICGFYLTWVTAILNLNSTSGAKFNWLFVEPSVFLATVYLDHTKMINMEMAAGIYVGFFGVTIVRYLLLMNNIVNQICSHMGLSFLRVKPVKKTLKSE